MANNPGGTKFTYVYTRIKVALQPARMIVVKEGQTNMMTLRRKILIGLAAVGLVVTPIVAQVGGGHGWFGAARGHFHRDPERMLEHLGILLDLTEAQKQAAKTLFTDARTQAEPVVAQLKQGHETMEAAVKGNRSDTEINDVAAKQGVLAGQLVAIHAKSMAKFYALLTPEQKAKADRVHDQIKSRFIGRK
jgi:Spy/CpxP family protein refolding chaperone